MGISQRMDFVTPLQEIAQRIGDAFKAAMPSDAKVKIELETTPLQEVEESIKRTRESVPQAAQTASEKLGGADGASDTASAEAEYKRAAQRIEAIAGRIGYLLQKIDAGKDATGNAALEVERLKDSLEKVAQKGRDAANALGDQGLAKKIDEAEVAAGQGKGGVRDGASLGDLESIMRNPMGSAMNKLKQGILQKYGGPLLEMLSADVATVLGGGMGAAGILGGAALGLGAAGAGFAYGWHLNTKWANEATGDAQKAYEDARLSNAFGKDFDLRGRTFDERRLTANTTTRYGQSLNNAEVKQALMGMGIGVDNWKGDIIETSMLESRAAQVMGVSTQQMSGMVGAAMRSGAFSGMGNSRTDDDTKVIMYLQMIAGATEEAARYGISSNEKLGVIATLNQKTVAETGTLSASAMHLNLQASQALDATGDRTLQGQMGAHTLDLMAGNGNDEAKARMIGLMMGPDGDLSPEYKKLLQDNPNAMRAYRTLGPVGGANALLDNKRVAATVFQRGVRMVAGGSQNPGMTELMMARMLGADWNLSQTEQALRGATEGQDILSQGLSNGDMTFNVNTAKGMESSNTQSLIASQTQTMESRKTAQDWEVYQSVIDTNREVAGTMRELRSWLSQHANVSGF